MVKSVLLLAIMAFFSVQHLLAEDAPLLLEGDISTQDVPASSGNWYGLYGQEGRYTLMPVDIAIEPYHHPAGDSEDIKSDKTKWSGRTLTAKPRSAVEENSELLILVQLASLKAGSVSTAFPENESFEDRVAGSFSPLRSLNVKLGETHYRLAGEFSGGACEIQLEIDTADAKNRMPAQLITSRSPDSGTDYSTLPFQAAICSRENPQVLWVGDMDRDGKADLLLETYHDSTYTRTLFLSSLAEEGKLVKRVGTFTRPTGC